MAGYSFEILEICIKCNGKSRRLGRVTKCGDRHKYGFGLFEMDRRPPVGIRSERIALQDGHGGDCLRQTGFLV